MIGASALARCADATKDTSQSLSRYQQARNVLRQRSSAVGGERFGLGALAGEAVGAGRGVAITLCPVVVVRGKDELHRKLFNDGLKKSVSRDNTPS